ncbi:DUF3783 domain-containing protein [Megasphaera paucivorans]|uniref:DUF3783 domain-containing protein n=1 Tax=Megasphaera paucivorans TaxID=349095 RepID=A0A1G9X089_9FIRM|nr:DUF3783 domain-containing protein [Megasphaera paucivorans]SDM90244.1 protein of unknown function [Megasphaera paucivorans]
MALKMILAINFIPERIKQLKLLALLTKSQIRIVTENDMDKTVGELLGFTEEEIENISALKKQEEKKDIPENQELMAAMEVTKEAIILCGFDSSALNVLLNGIRRGPLKNIPLKAGVTPNNISWNIYTILQEISKEHDYFEAQKKR